ncbi:MAG: putative Diadenosine tetraphosphate (Ap4A) hydrolase [Phenylobacterium sp.]|nr:putative Diadenosine tetraphosphate (Ap4A) hydrolase [Phenylobacterium sp.]
MTGIDPAFLTTSEALGELALCHARLQADARFPWIVLIPRVSRARELEDLTPDQRRLLMDEILAAGHAVRAVAQALGRPTAKLNVGQLGNVTPQLHVHVVGRRSDDPAWPGPVWGFGAAEAYAAADLAQAVATAKEMLGF